MIIFMGMSWPVSGLGAGWANATVTIDAARQAITVRFLM